MVDVRVASKPCEFASMYASTGCVASLKIELARRLIGALDFVLAC